MTIGGGLEGEMGGEGFGEGRRFSTDSSEEPEWEKWR